MKIAGFPILYPTDEVKKRTRTRTQTQTQTGE
jgi:hypothetical protein